MINLCDKSNCTGCGLCAAVCSRNAISFEIDFLGFRYPQIDPIKCIGCGLCAKKCPSINPVKHHDNNECYLAWAKDNTIHYDSSSGGIAYLLQRSFIDHGGYVIGCVWDENFNARLVVIDNEGGLSKTVGSKYVQSYISDETWNEIRTRNRSGQQGLFVGLPCQVAAVKSFTNNSSNILFVDLLCRGGCSPSCLKTHLSHLIKKRNLSTITDLRFRGGETDCYITLWKDNKIVYKGGQLSDAYFYSFMKHGLLHDSCYRCQYANSKRVSDITLADFWGIDSEFVKDKNTMNGTNLVIVHSEKGRIVWTGMKDEVECFKRTFEEAALGNDTLREPTPPPNDRDTILSLINNIGFENAIWHDCEYRRQRRLMFMSRFVKGVRRILPRRFFVFLKSRIKKLIK